MSFIKLTDLTSKEIVPGYHGRFLHTEHNTISHWKVEAGATLPEHAHEHEQTSIVLEGKFELTVDGEARLLEPGEWALIPSNVPHSGKAHTACTIMDIFYPVREDYR
ncbi:MAG: cupin domain-containing protein [Anaerolineales bacterium]|nr:cupin domain-containing protein [Anaerolineales bacterium]